MHVEKRHEDAAILDTWPRYSEAYIESTKL
jgi:hypothetical protein